MVFTRTLNIKRGDVGKKPVTLLLTFQVPDPSKLYRSQFNIAWKVADFTGEGREDLRAVYISQLFVANPQITSGNHVKPNQWIKIDPGQRTTLEQNGPGVRFTTPVKGSGKLIIADNNTGHIKDLGIGIVEGTDDAVPLLYFPDIGQGSSLTAQFTPVLQAYIISGYQETTLLKGAIETKKPIWTKDLTSLRDSTHWVFSKDPETGAYSIVEVALAE